MSSSWIVREWYRIRQAIAPGGAATCSAQIGEPGGPPGSGSGTA